MAADASSNSGGDNATIPSSSWGKPNCNKVIDRSEPCSTGWIGGFVSRMLLVHLPLALVTCSFSFLAATCSFLYIYKTYYTPLIDGWSNFNDDRLENEMTYYNRQCGPEDATALDSSALFLPRDATHDDYVENMMLHGTSVFPIVVDPDTASELREYVLWRNAHLTSKDSIIVGGDGGNRWSFGLSPSDHPVVPRALREIATHSMLQPTLHELLGDDDPAVIEITAITSACGAEPQGVHSDNRAEGSSVQFARTFAQSYSLFIALQNTTGGMGATRLCPGTHRCANSIENAPCTEEGEGGVLPLDPESGLWKAGDGVVFHNSVFHMGGGHVDPRPGRERAVLVVTFANRPLVPLPGRGRSALTGGVDNRQIAHGTFFHIKTNLWGRTWKDLVESESTDWRWPLAPLRSLGLYKPRSREWGWDWTTTALWRIANEDIQYMGWTDLNTFLFEWDALGLPRFLWGLDPDGVEAVEDVTWRDFIENTAKNVADFAQSTHSLAVLGYISLAVLATLIIPSGKGRAIPAVTRSTLLRRLVLSHGLVALFTAFLLLHISASDWARCIRRGTCTRRPFPDYEGAEDLEASGGVDELQPAVTRGSPLGSLKEVIEYPTTFPQPSDILLGSGRLDARHLGAFQRFLDYHPGNLVWGSAIAGVATAFALCSHFPTSIEEECSGEIVSSIVGGIASSGGRFLLQTEQGDWTVLPPTVSEDRTRLELLKNSGTLRGGIARLIDKEASYFLADLKFGSQRDTAMARWGRRALEEWRRILFSQGKVQRLGEAVSLARPPRRESPAFSVVCRSVDSLSSNTVISSDQVMSRLATLAAGIIASETLKEGDKVEAYFAAESRWYRGIIISQNADNGNSITHDVEFDDGDVEEKLRTSWVRRWPGPLIQGEEIETEIDGEGMVTGLVATVKPNGRLDLYFPDDQTVLLGIDIKDNSVRRV